MHWICIRVDRQVYPSLYESNRWEIIFEFDKMSAKILWSLFNYSASFTMKKKVTWIPIYHFSLPQHHSISPTLHISTSDKGSMQERVTDHLQMTFLRLTIIFTITFKTGILSLDDARIPIWLASARTYLKLRGVERNGILVGWITGFHGSHFSTPLPLEAPCPSFHWGLRLVQARDFSWEGNSTKPGCSKYRSSKNLRAWRNNCSFLRSSTFLYNLQ